MIDDASRPTATPILACHECGLIHRMRPLPDGERAKCVGCGAVLYRERRDSIERTLMITIAALVLFVIAHGFPFLIFKLEGRAQVTTLPGAILALWDARMWPLALLIFVVGSLAPLLKLLGNLYVLLPLHLGHRPPGLAPVFRAVDLLHPWAMMEVYLLGVIVSYVKLADLAHLDFGVALYAFVAAIFVMAWAEAALDPREVWERIAPQARARLPLPSGARWLSCHDCAQLVRAPGHGHGARCPRCGAALHHRKPDSVARTWALLIAAMILYVPANLLPVMTVISFGRGSPDTIMSGVILLIQLGSWPVAALIFFASITVPVLKILAMVYLLVSVQMGSSWRRRDRTFLYRVTEAVGRWSMVDVFVVAILVALVSLGSIAAIQPGAGAVCFAAVVVLTMFAAMSFDPRLIWDLEEGSHARHGARA